MSALVRMPPKQHEQMKMGKKPAPVKRPQNKRVTAKPKSV
jgi:hypothetical protein